ncbi:mechanosensitive ion channel [Leptobacterium flavescens]|uniref:Mechanosensing system component YbdG n=1 Tax=Leptobacterium flavescens TaxID=472055 RepID=A0A6P0UL76_9FLAO|nr:mechanosensitive ion channel domain-containing protein [Leptobacterium flavescens]NER13727.1 mechanosensitive ion channel [Leptobacterium flavescens]
MNYQEDIQRISRWLYNYLIKHNYSETTAQYANLFLNLIVVVLLVFLLDRFLRRVIVRAFLLFSNKTKSTFDDFLVKSNFPRYAAHFAPLFLFEESIPYVFQDFPDFQDFILKVTDIYLIILVVWIIRSVIKSIREYLKSKDSFKDKPLDSYSQVIIMFIWFVGFLYIFSELTGQDILKFLTTLGAASAILLLVFRDTILGFVASIQVSVNDMVRIGDWVTLEKYGADGDVIEINLTTVKVRNFDNTITTIPTYSLISGSFKNWRGMQESGGRRIKRSILIAANSIRFLKEEDLQKLSNISLIKNYLQHRQEDIEDYNSSNSVNKELLINGRNQTNMGVFRKYANMYLHEHPAINKDMMVMVRQLAPTAQGIPLEIYAFSSDKRWENYEHIMADIFDHLLSSVSYFDLEVFELTKGKDILELKAEDNKKG